VIWEVPGVSVGHWTDVDALTGCSVVLLAGGAVASGEVRGGAPATHEFSVLDPFATVERIDAVVLSGGSAFGLAATAGVAAWCEEHGRGYPTAAGPVPIVVGMGLFDLTVGDPSVRPGPDQGRAACDAAGDRSLGRVGAGCGATVGKWRGPDAAVPGGTVGAVVRDGDLVVAALVAVNAWGDVAGAGRAGEPWPVMEDPGDGPGDGAAVYGNTTIGVVATNARLDKVGCHHVARGAHDGLARAVTPPHARVDGDAFVAVSSGAVVAPVELVRAHAVEVVDTALRTLGGPAGAPLGSP
jgi:L-aminopeptidase/D-esterase-like protein